jgi:hypothetical protein
VYLTNCAEKGDNKDPLVVCQQNITVTLNVVKPYLSSSDAIVVACVVIAVILLIIIVVVILYCSVKKYHSNLNLRYKKEE